MKLWTSKSCHTHPKVAAAQVAWPCGQTHLSADSERVWIMNKQQQQTDLFNIEWKLIYSLVTLTHSDGQEFLFYCFQKLYFIEVWKKWFNVQYIIYLIKQILVMKKAAFIVRIVLVQVRCPKAKGTNKVGKYRFIHVNINIERFSSHINSTCMHVCGCWITSRIVWFF